MWKYKINISLLYIEIIHVMGHVKVVNEEKEKPTCPKFLFKSRKVTWTVNLLIKLKGTQLGVVYQFTKVTHVDRVSTLDIEIPRGTKFNSGKT